MFRCVSPIWCGMKKHFSPHISLLQKDACVSLSTGNLLSIVCKQLFFFRKDLNAQASAKPLLT
jgi:hypothetical protein